MGDSITLVRVELKCTICEATMQTYVSQEVLRDDTEFRSVLKTLESTHTCPKTEDRYQ